MITPNHNDTNSVFFKLKGNVLIVCNNGEPFSIGGIESLMNAFYSSKSERVFEQPFKSSVINEQVKELIEERHKLYHDNPKEIEIHYNIENSTVSGYHGREILELMQNCIDAMPGDSTFQIGSKGLGFRSLLNWCDRIEIYSGELSVAFGLKEKEKFKESLGLTQNIAILSAPCIIEPKNLNYTTEIVLNLKKSVIDDVKKELEQIDEKSMVFLPKIEKLVIEIENFKRIYEKLEDTNGDVLIYSIDNGTRIEQFWRVFKQERKTITLVDPYNKTQEYNYEISIAFCEDNNILDNNFLYSYFKTDIQFPIGWLCNADFELNSDRSKIIDHSLNRVILKELVSLIDVASETIAGSLKNPESALKSIVPIDKFPEIAGFDFSSYYAAQIGKRKILPTVNGEFVALSEFPWLANGDSPALFTGDAFKKLLKLSNNKGVIDFVKKIAARDKIQVNIPIQEIQHAINTVSADWSPGECFAVFEWWRIEYGSNTNALYHLPNLIGLENGEWASGNDKPFFKEGKVPNVPSWVNFNFLRDDYQKAAINFYNKEEGYLKHKSQGAEQDAKQRDERAIPGYVRIGKVHFFRYLDRSTTIAPINSSVGDNWHHAQEFVFWLYENYGNDADWSPPETTGYNFPVQNGVVAKSDTLYFGEYYNNQLAAILAMQDGQEELFHFPISSEEKESFALFLKKFGVRSLPRRRPIVFKDSNWPSDYLDALHVHFSSPLQLGNDINIVNPQEKVKIISINVESYINLENILSISKTSDLFLWILKDDFIKNSLIKRHEINDEFPLKLKLDTWRTRECKVPREQVRNYIAHTFMFTKWIEIGGKRYSPNQIILDGKIGTQLEPHLIGIKRDDVFSGLSIEEYEINAIINNLGFINNFSKIKPSSLYKILNELSKDHIDVNGELSKKIYEQIMEASDLKTPDASCQERIAFFQHGKIYCLDGQFHKVQEVRYADKSFPDRVRAGQYLISLRKGRGAKKAALWFGTKEFKPNIAVRSFEESCFNQQFQNDFHELLKGLYIENYQHNKLITDDNSWRSVKNMRIVLASRVALCFGEFEQSCDVYEYAKDDSGQYILMIGNKMPDHFRDERLTSVLLEILRTVIEIDRSNLISSLSSSFRELWRYPDGVLRDALIQRYDDKNIWQEADSFFDGSTKLNSDNDIVSKNMNMFIKCRDDNLDKFKRILYAKLITETSDKQKEYLVKIEQYKRIEPSHELLLDDLCDVFSLLLSIEPANLLIEDDRKIDVDAIGKETRKKLFEYFPDSKSDLLSFLNIKEYDSILRFGNYDFLKAEFERDIGKQKNIEENISSLNSKSPVVIDSENVDFSHVSHDYNKKDNPSNHGSGYTDYRKKQDKDTKAGKSAEKTVYDDLVRSYGESNVKWVSQFAYEEGVNLDGSDHYGHDIEYFDGKEKIYVEVKKNSASLPVISFRLTATQRDFAKANNKYKIFVVTAPESEEPIILPLSWNDISSFVNTPTGYLVEFKQQERDNL
ncbi:MAG: hypothetical protein LBV80_02355 [Deltaproteobacteria bacterium]|jgi:hypothetical protein|nr:hypothetical protein [Deltaproteobacteria bacterium]